MKFVKLASLFCVCAGLSFGANKETVELQRDVAILQDQVRQIQRTLDEKLSQLTLLVQQTQDSASKASNGISTIQSSVGDTLSQRIQPVTQLGGKVDSLTDDVHGLRDTINDLSSRLSKLDAKVTDVGNRMSIMQNPPGAPGTTGTMGTMPPGPGGDASAAPMGGAAPPAGLTAESAWTNAEHDRLTGNSELALKEYQDYITYFANTDYAPSAQYRVGEIYYNRGDYDNALKAFDTMLERFPDNPRTSSAHLMKGQTLVKTGDRSGAVKEFRYTMEKYPRTDDATRAADALRRLGVTATAAKPSPARRKH